LFLLIFLTGCGQSGPEVVRVHGTVTRAGKPIPDLMVNFVPDNGRPSIGLTDAKGHYTLQYDKTHEGALVGNHKVFFVYRPQQQLEPGAEMGRGGMQKMPPEVTAILAKYGKYEITPLKIEIKKDSKVVDLSLD
jgi:hypothetical protein